ncbi:hypothetical protein SBOR_6301 [Sclerotinia borealis F-4128]|uniref:Secreted protein n=1 Tax=Sclerotinia borealis (strain F-4128) TaxID=1432307 RepID=W9CFN7_SCLBF|nr:hypothetical protein SBOR_6301 [Sclerotinia borealis F-4128]
MKLVIFSQVFLGFISIILGSPLSPDDSLVPLDIRDDSKCPSAKSGLCTVEVLVYTESIAAFGVNLYDQGCTEKCHQIFNTRNTPLSWTPACLGIKNLTVQVDQNGELHPIIRDKIVIHIGIVPDGNKNVVTHRAPFPCPTSSVTAVATSTAAKTTTAPATPAGNPCTEIPIVPSCIHPVGSGFTGEGV